MASMLYSHGHIDEIVDLSRDKLVKVCGSLTRNRVDRGTRVIAPRTLRRKKMSSELPPPAAIEPWLAEDSRWAGCKFDDLDAAWIYEYEGFAIVSNSNLLRLTRDRTVHEVMRDRWYYIPCVQTGPATDKITRKKLFDRVKEGKFIGYKYVATNFMGNPLVYYGFVPSSKCTDLDYFARECHKTPVIALKPVYPRIIYAKIVRCDECLDCPPESGCSLVSYADARSNIHIRSCLKRLDWTRLRFELGKLEETQCNERALSEQRCCKVCASCLDCESLPTFCSKHRVCRHASGRTVAGAKDPLVATLRQGKLIRNKLAI